MSDVTIEPYRGPAGGWGSARSLTRYLASEGALLSDLKFLQKQNKPHGFACVSCAWAKPAEPHLFEFCENGAKATIWEQTSRRADAAFFEKHSVSELLGWSDYQLEKTGRLTEPLRYDAAADRYVPTSWAEAAAAIGAELKAIEPKSAVFYASGRASLETSYMYALFARLYGHNNLPDSSNMCHETTSVALPQAIGVPVGTVSLEDFEKTDLMFFFGHNTGSNAPRLLHPLQEARKRGVPIITFNPLRERGLERFTNPQNPVEMLSGAETQISTAYHQVRSGGDLAALTGLCKALLDADKAAQASGSARLIDTAFIAEHTQGFDQLAAFCDRQGWGAIERRSGLGRTEIEATAAAYARSQRTIFCYGMGLTQHRQGTPTLHMLLNLLLLRGNIGKPGAGICPIRGHSNVQGQRTVGITEKPELAPLDKLKELYRFEPPQEKGLTTVEVCEGVLDGSVKAFLSLGGNFVRAVPDTDRIEPAWRRLNLSVQVATKLNRSHLVPGKVTYLLPCLGRIEKDEQVGGLQMVTIEDSTAHFHASRGLAEPVSEHARSEAWIVAEIAKATLAPNPHVDWDGWVGDYARVRDAMEATYPKVFKDFNARVDTPGGIPKPLAARERRWETETGKANFLLPKQGLDENPDIDTRPADVLTLITLRSNDQFNTTVYGYDDRFRGVKGTRMVLFMNPADIARLGLAVDQVVALETHADDHRRRVEGLRIVAYDIPAGDCGGYYPELNPLVPLWHHDEEAKTPAAKAVPVRVVA